MPQRILYVFILLLVVAATAYRLFPIFLGQPWLSEFFVTEDGYLMLTVARNMAIGLGMSVSDGTIPTNGVQPLATLIFASFYWLTDGDKVSSLIGVVGSSALIALGGVFAVRRFAEDMLSTQTPDRLWSWLVAALWFTGPLLLFITMNALETGLYTLVVMLTLIWFGRVLGLKEETGAGDRLILGALCGVAFLSRNDGAFLSVAIFTVWFFYELIGARRGIVDVVIRLLPPGIVSLAIASPWLLNNKLNFGSFVPISGSAQAFGSNFGQNLSLIPVKLFEHTFPMLPVPSSVEASTALVAISAALVFIIHKVFLVGVLRRGGPAGIVVIAYTLYGLLLCGYYGLFFGAPHFVSRYLAPLSPLLIVAAVSVMLMVTRLIGTRHWAPIAASLGIAGLLLSSALLIRQLMPGVNVHQHFQVVRWVQENVPEDVWVGAPQTGTLGYWHDRTINLDGKVNPEALNTLLREGHILNYVINSKIEYIADWVGMAGWMTLPQANFGEVFELLVEDPDANLAVMRRRSVE